MIGATEAAALVGVGILLTALYLQSESFIDPLIRGIALQSLLVAGLLAGLAWEERSPELAVLAGLTIAVRSVLIPYVLRAQIGSFRWRVREVRAVSYTHLTLPTILLV